MVDSSKNPEEWITELEQIRNRIIGLKAPFSEGRLIGHILTNPPVEYNMTVEAIQREIITSGRVPPLEELLGQIRTKLKLMENQKGTNGNKMALLATTFKGRCQKCGEFGHKFVDCKSNTNNANAGSRNGKDIVCFFCNKKGLF